jgi:hypothetical protein
LEAITKKGSLEVLGALDKFGTLRFTDLGSYVGNPRTLSIRLRELQDLGLIEAGKDGYSLSERGKTVLAIIRRLQSMLSPPEDNWFKPAELERIPQGIFRPIIHQYCNLLQQHFGNRLVSVAVFGSVAQGTAKINQSDIDVLIVVDGWTDDVWLRIRELMEVEKELSLTPEYRTLSVNGIWTSIQNYPLSSKEATHFHRVYLDMIHNRAIVYDREKRMETYLEELRQKLKQLGSYKVINPDGTWYWVLKPDLKAGEDLIL